MLEIATLIQVARRKPLTEVEFEFLLFAIEAATFKRLKKMKVLDADAKLAQWGEWSQLTGNWGDMKLPVQLSISLFHTLHSLREPQLNRLNAMVLAFAAGLTFASSTEGLAGNLIPKVLREMARQAKASTVSNKVKRRKVQQRREKIRALWLRIKKQHPQWQPHFLITEIAGELQRNPQEEISHRTIRNDLIALDLIQPKKEKR